MSILGPDEQAVIAAPEGTRRPVPWSSFRKLAVLVGVLGVFGAMGGGGWYLLHHDATAADSVAGCRSGKPLPRALEVRVLNSTDRPKLARNTGDTLLARGFRVRSVGNVQQNVTQAAQVRHPVGDIVLAQRVMAYVPGAVLVSDRRVVGEVDLVLGTAFTRIRTAAEVAALSKPKPKPVPKPVASRPSAKATKPIPRPLCT